MAVDVDLETFDRKMVYLTMEGDDGDAIEREGKVEAASQSGIAFKEKGKRDVELIEPHQIVEIAIAPSKPKKITQKPLKMVNIDNVRQHLADRHGFLLSEVNELSPEDAWEAHENIDHDGLAHRHKSPEEEAKSGSSDDAEVDSDGDEDEEPEQF